ncbi:MAG: acyl-CoA dehydrogenase family protein [Planctomycetaceae bacterium]
MTTSSLLDQARRLRERWFVSGVTSDAVWPGNSWNELCSAGVTRWGIPEEFGGQSVTADQLLRGLMELARGDLLATFVLSQFQAAAHRLTRAPSPALRQRWLPGLAKGQLFATVGISHLTTSRQHTARPAVEAEPATDGYRLTGEIPWVTGGPKAQVLVVGGALTDGRQILAAIPGDRAGVTIGESCKFAALSGSETCAIRLAGVMVDADELMAGPVGQVVQQFGGGGAGSLTTSALGLGHAWGCLDHLREERKFRSDLEPAIAAFTVEADSLSEDLIAASTGTAEASVSPESLRTRSIDLALRASQAYLTASKGAGFVSGHPAERLARQALFFLVWSCPQVVANQLLQAFGRCDSGL